MKQLKFAEYNIVYISRDIKETPIRNTKHINFK